MQKENSVFKENGQNSFFKESRTKKPRVRVPHPCSESLTTELSSRKREPFTTDLPITIGSDGWNRATDWLVQDYIQERSIGFVTGASQDLKTFTLLHMAYCVAKGVDFGDLKVKKGGVIYICAESAGGFTKRLKGIEDQYGALVESNFITVTRPVSIMDKNEQQKLESLIDEASEKLSDPPSLVVIDTFSQCSAGIDENSATSVTEYLGICRNLTQKYGVSIVNVHHLNKEGTFRGSGAIFNDSDFIITTKRDKETPEQEVSTVVSLDKSKESDTEIAHRVSFSEKQLGISDNFGRKISTLVVEKIIRIKKPSRGKQKREDGCLILNILGKTPNTFISQSSLNQAFFEEFPETTHGTLRKRVSHACSQLVIKGDIEEKKDGKSKL